MAKQEQEAVRVQGLSQTLDHTPSGAALEAGEIVQIGGDLVGVASSAIPDGTLGALETEGVFKVSKEDSGPGPTFAAGVEVDWDNTAKEAVAGGTGDFSLGTTVEAAVATDQSVKTWINKKAF